jgi:hypothetical protein
MTTGILSPRRILYVKRRMFLPVKKLVRLHEKAPFQKFNRGAIHNCSTTTENGEITEGSILARNLTVFGTDLL